MSNEIGDMIFVAGGFIVALLLLLRIRRVSSKDVNAAVAAAFGLFLCGRYAAVIQGNANWTFTIGVAFLMALLAYRSLGFGSKPQTPHY